MLGMVELNLCHFCSDKWRKWAGTVFLFFLAFEFEPQVKIPNKNWSTLILSVNDSLICWGWWSSICATFVQTSEENEQALYSYFSSLSSLLYNRTARYQIKLDFQVEYQNSRSIFIHIVLFYLLLFVLILTLAVKK